MRDDDGRIFQKAFAGQTFDRTVHRGDLTGIEIMSRLNDRVLAADLIILDEHRTVELLDSGTDSIGGALLLDVRTGGFVAVSARATLMATGGGARMYSVAAPSLEKAGDGMALCYRSGCIMQDMEMYQFHPTGLVAGRSILTGAVLPERSWKKACVGPAATFITITYNYNAPGGVSWNDTTHSEWNVPPGTWYPGRAIWKFKGGGGTDDGAALLDVSHLGARFVEDNFPGMVERCREVGFDLARGSVKVSPTAHFHMGGAALTNSVAQIWRGCSPLEKTLLGYMGRTAWAATV